MDEIERKMSDIRKITVDFSKWEEKTGKGPEKIGVFEARAIIDAGDSPLYIDPATDEIYAPVMSRGIFEKFYGNVKEE